MKHKTSTSHAPWKNGPFEGMNCSLQENIRCIVNWDDKNYTEPSIDVKLLFPHVNNSQSTKTIRLSSFEMVFNQKPRKSIIYTLNSSNKT